jgi:hypothetical protein
MLLIHGHKVLEFIDNGDGGLATYEITIGWSFRR